MSGLKIAVVGATGAVGKEMFRILEERKFPVADCVPFSSPRSEGKEIKLLGRSYKVQVMKPGCFDGIDIAFFDASDAISKEWVPEATKSGAWVVDNSATYRMETDIPLLVPEVNGELLDRLLAKANPTPRERILAGPNCTTVQLMVALKPLRDKFGLKRVVVSTYQATSGAGAAAMEELKVQLADSLAGRPVENVNFVHPIAFNCIPQIGGFKDDGYTSEELKVIHESRKILGMPDLRITATAVRVPTLSCHGESVNVECERPVTADEARAAMRAQDGLEVVDDPQSSKYPMNLTGTGRDPVYVGRIRRDFSVDHGLSFWVVSDNLRKGAALNAVQVGERIAKSLRR